MRKIFIFFSFCGLLFVWMSVAAQSSAGMGGYVDANLARGDSAGRVVTDWDGYEKYRIGSYGEMLFNRMNYGPNRYKSPDGAPRDSRSYITIPRTVFAGDYKFRDDIILSTEIEFEYGGAGAAMEYEYTEAGEYEGFEVEKAGEVALEQFHITKRFFPWLNVRVGHFIVPVGITNAHHEPVFFFGTSRPEGERALLPSTWHETGISVLGYLRGFKYEVMLVNGLSPNGFSTENWVGSGKQGILEDVVTTHPAVAARVEYSGVKNLRLGLSGYYGNTTKNTTKPAYAGLKGAVSIFSADAQYNSKDFTMRANIIYGDLTDSKAISEENRRLFRSTFGATTVAKNAMTYAVEAGYNIFSFLSTKTKLYPFVRYEYYNTAQSVEEGVKEFPRFKRDLTIFGFNYFLLPNLTLKADYAIRRIDNGNYNSEHTFSLGVAYTTWFFSK
ncbi:MAG: porin family protein [Tannerellaceae bacterium]|nr:porin family protein [Tannerellaceae bacterium]